MRNLIARLFEPAFLLLGLHGRKPPLLQTSPMPEFLPMPPPVATAPRRLLLCRAAMPVGMTPRPPDGPYSQAAYNRWERAENRMRRERRRALWLASCGIDVGPHTIHGVMVR